MAASLFLPNGMQTVNNVPEISRYYNLAGQPYINTAQVLSEVTGRYIGQTFNVNGTEYWFKGGVTNGDLKIKIEELAGELISKFTSNPTYTIDEAVIYIPANQTWLINSIGYTNPIINEIPFDYAGVGASYFLTIVATKFNTFIARIGGQSLSNPDEPIIDLDEELPLTTFLVYDNEVTVIIPPVNSNIYVEKEIYQPQITIGSAPVGAIAMGKKSALVIAGTVPSIEFIIKNNSNDYFIGQPFQTTNKTPNLVKFTHLSSDVAGNPNSISWFNPELTDYYASPNELTAWNLDIIDGQKVYRRATTYIDTDNVVFRSGTKTDKPITGDLEFAKEIGLKTDELIGGLRSSFYGKDGVWNVQINGVVGTPNFKFAPNKGLISDTFFDKESDNLAFAQMGDVLPLADRIFDLELVVDNKADLVGGLVPSSQLPSYVDDILEFANLASFPAVGEIGKIYIAISPSNLQYRWTGTTYVAMTNGFIASTNDVPEGSSNLYFTTARVLATVVGTFSSVLGAVVSTDSIFTAIWKLQNNLSELLGRTTGTNTGDNAVNTNSNAYADSKVADAIVDGVANVAPSQNAVFDALVLKQNAITDTNFGSFTNAVSDKATQANTDVLAYVDITTGKWVKQTFSKLVDYLKGFFQPKIKVIYIGSDTTLSDIHNGCVLIVTATVVLTIPSGLGATFTSCVIDVKVGQCTIGTAVGVTATGYYSLILATGDTTSIVKESDGTNNFRIK